LIRAQGRRRAKRRRGRWKSRSRPVRARKNTDAVSTSRAVNRAMREESWVRKTKDPPR
jgi:hypothetical protein